MLRLICFSNNFDAASTVGGPVDVEHKTFELTCSNDIAEAIAWLSKEQKYIHRGITGVEVVGDLR